MRAIQELGPAASLNGGSQAENPSDKHARFLNTNKFSSLDGLRATAILAVLWHHHPNYSVSGWMFTYRGFLGVDLFFIISGFLIVTLLLRERRHTATLSLQDFYVRRILRIFPAYYLMLLVVGGVALAKPAAAASVAVRHDFPFALFFISNLVAMQSLLAITWSLSVEEQFYLIAPALEKHARRVLPYLLPAAYVVAVLPTFGFFAELQLPSFFRETTFGAILLGVMLAHALDSRHGFAWIFRLTGSWLAPLIALGLVFAAASYPGEEFVGWPRIFAHWSMLMLIASCVVRERNILTPLLQLWPMRRIGVVSYGMYLYHLLVNHFVIKGFAAVGLFQGHAVFVCNALATWLVAELSFRLFEVRFLKLKARFAPRASHTCLRLNK